MFFLLFLLAMFAAGAKLQATEVYRYEWVPTGDSTPNALGTPFSGYIDFLAPSGNVTSPNLNAIYDLQFTAEPSAGGLPNLPAFTYSLSDVHLPGPDITVVWNSQKITDLESGIDDVGLINPATASGYFALITATDVQTEYPSGYFPDEVFQQGSWQYQGSLNVGVPDQNSGSLLLLLGLLAVSAVYRFTGRHGSTPA